MFLKLNTKMPEHEHLSDHEKAFNKGKMLEMTLNKDKALDSKLQEQTLTERHIRTQVLVRLLDVVLFLMEQNLPSSLHRKDVFSS